jgi:DNA-binding transcriptional ArsR family regulator
MESDNQSEARTRSALVDPETVEQLRANPLDPKLVEQFADIFRALADPTRVRMLHALSHSELCVGDLAILLGMTDSAVSHQLRLLRDLRVLRARRDGKLVYYALDDEHIASLFQQTLEHLGHH